MPFPDQSPIPLSRGQVTESLLTLLATQQARESGDKVLRQGIIQQIKKSSLASQNNHLTGVLSVQSLLQNTEEEEESENKRPLILQITPVMASLREGMS